MIAAPYGSFEELAGVAVRDAGGELLQRDVDDAVGDARRDSGTMPDRHLTHARTLELAHVDRPRDREVVADHDRVATFLGRPPAVPLAPHVVVAELAVDAAEVVREVVLGEEVEEAARCARPRHSFVVVGIPRLAFGVVATAAPRHHLVREPLLGGTEVTLEQLDRTVGSSSASSCGVVHGIEGSPPTDR